MNPFPTKPAQDARETLLVLHASATPAHKYLPLVSALDARFELLLPDRLGYGPGARWPVGSPASLRDEAAHLMPLLDARRGGVHVLAHSYGGAVALQLALERADRVRSLTLYEPGRFGLLVGSDPGAAGQEILRVGRDVGMQVLSGVHHVAGRLFVDYWSGTGSWEQLNERQRAAVAQHMPRVQAEFEAAFADRVALQSYEALEMPVHLLVGETSPRPMHRIVALLASRMPGAVVTMVAGVGHMAPLKAPALVSKRFDGCLTTTPPTLALTA